VSDILKGRGGFVAMVFSVLSIVLMVTLFNSILTAFQALAANTHIATFLAFSIGLKISPTILLLIWTFGSAAGFVVGYMNVSNSGGDTAGIIRMVFGILMVVLFATLFNTILDNFYILWLADNATKYFIAFQTVCTIIPTILFLSGIFAGVGTSIGGAKTAIKKFKGKKGAAAAAAG
jgi:hypothetical protein